MKVLKQPELPNDLMFHTMVVRSGDLPDGNESTVAVEVPVSELETKEDTHTNLYTAHVSIVAEIKDKSGAVVEHFGEDVSKRGSLETADKGKSDVITLQRHFMSFPGQYTAEVAIKDEQSGKTSAKRIPFEIPDPAKVEGPALSDMVLVRKMAPYDEEADPTEPMRYEKAKVTPNLTGLVPHDTKQVSMFVILHPDPKATDPPVLEMQVIHNGKPGRRVPLPLKKVTKEEAVPYLASFPNSLSPGFYQVKATLTQDGKTVEQSIAFTVMGNGATTAATNEGSGDVDLQAAAEVDPALGGHLAITVPSSAIVPPSPEDVNTLIGDARKQAVNYAESLPNFLCVEVTNRSIDLTGTGDWKHRDTIAELLRYVDKKETRTTIEVNGDSTNSDRDAMLVKQSAFSSGELGGVLKAVFDPKAQAEFKWKETDTLGNGTVQVFTYHVSLEHSDFTITGSNNMAITVGFHGQVFIDTSTHSVRRLTLIADDIPKDFPTHSTAIAVDYDYVVINTHDYLVPVSAEMSLRQGRHEAVMNTMEFRDYRRYGSNVRILEACRSSTLRVFWGIHQGRRSMFFHTFRIFSSNGPRKGRGAGSGANPKTCRPGEGIPGGGDEFPAPLFICCRWATSGERQMRCSMLRAMRRVCAFILLSGLAVLQAQQPAPGGGADEHLRNGVEAQRRGDLTAAINEYRTALSIEPKMLEARANLGAALSAAGQFDAAIEEDNKALAQAPENIALRKNLGLAYYKKGDMAQARTEFEAVHKARPSDIGTAVLLGYADLKLGKAGDAAAMLMPLETGHESNMDFEYVFAYALIQATGSRPRDCRGWRRWRRRRTLPMPTSLPGRHDWDGGSSRKPARIWMPRWS